MTARRLAVATLTTVALVLAAQPAAAARPALSAGAGQADITPRQTGYFLGGWTRADRLALGQSSRLYANTIVLRRGGKRVALVAVELFAVFAGMQEDVAREVADLGYTPATVLLAASHTHSGPGGYANNPTYNTAVPSVETVTDPLSYVRLLRPAPADRQLYTFLVERIAQSIRRADADLAPAAAAWGRSRLTRLTQNRSIEAHLANHGIDAPFGEGRAEQDPDGVVHTIDPAVDVLRVDKVRRSGRRVPIGAWSNFANHGTVVHSEFQAYSGDHHAAAWRVFAARVRKAGRVPRRQTVVNVYPNSDEGDQTAGIEHVGPAAAQAVGTREANAMFRAWRRAGRHLARRAPLAVRSTRTCFCGRPTATGPVASKGVIGIGFLTGSEEGRGPLFDVTGVPLEGRTSPVSDPEQGNKVQAPAGDFPPAVPVTVLRVGDGAIASIPGEPTKEIGARVKAAVLEELRPAGVRGVVIAGLANEFIQYVTTPEEYGTQSYEGASSAFGPNEGTFLVERLAELARAVRTRRAAHEPYPLDTSYGVQPDGAPYGPGADHATAVEQPARTVARLRRAAFSWDGGAKGVDRPVDRAFVTAQRRRGGRWRRVADDLGMQFLWRVDDAGRYRVQWEVPLSARTGRYRLRVTGTRYRLASRPFRVLRSTALTVAPARRGGVELRYPPAVVNVDLTHRPRRARGGRVTSDVGTVRSRRARRFAVPSGATIPAGGARDRYGNRSGAAFRVP